ncbi:RNA polymerase sigma factor [Rhodococcus sp. NPDC058514]|uniref:RNA polymerase sigma factor n=1 Tax=unclassified Rhodococcus (in: high G+C Gram-positive bacteria) TaxID=192944 RepID=UPI00364D4577
MDEVTFGHLLRDLARQVLGALVRRYGHFDMAEDAVQEALLAAALQWPHEGVPADPRSWLIRVASRRMIDQLRSEQARRRREDSAVARIPSDELLAPPADIGPSGREDDSLSLLIMCCHPALSGASQVALTLRAVGGLTTAEIATALLTPESTIGQRISRAKAQIKRSGTAFQLPPEDERAERLDAVLHVLYLIFNEGYTSSSGPNLHRVELSAEAIRLTRLLRAAVPENGEVAGLLALMLLTDARRPARSTADGLLIPMAEQDRGLWNRDAIDEGIDAVTGAMARTALGPYQLQAAIAALHAEAPTAETTDWMQILGLYTLLETMTDNPAVTLNRAVATAMVYGPRAGLRLLDTLDDEPRLARSHRPDAVRAHLLELTGDLDEAAVLYRSAARKTTSIPERDYLRARAARLGSAAG